MLHLLTGKRMDGCCLETKLTLGTNGWMQREGKNKKYLVSFSTLLLLPQLCQFPPPPPLPLFPRLLCLSFIFQAVAVRWLPCGHCMMFDIGLVITLSTWRCLSIHICFMSRFGHHESTWWAMSFKILSWNCQAIMANGQMSFSLAMEYTALGFSLMPSHVHDTMALWSHHNWEKEALYIPWISTGEIFPGYSHFSHGEMYTCWWPISASHSDDGFSRNSLVLDEKTIIERIYMSQKISPSSFATHLEPYQYLNALISAIMSTSAL